MEKAKFIFFFIYCFSMVSMLMGSTSSDGCGPASYRKLFVFGDSYADTGNLGHLGRSFTQSWYTPYGMTFPQYPTGRFSDGRLLTDFIASFLGIKSPVPYKYRRIGSKLLPYGMNFAVAGTGVFDTGNQQRNLSGQINNLEAQIKEGIYSECDLNSSVALVCIDGNDYTYYLDNGGKLAGLGQFMERLIDQLKLDLKRIYDIGVRKLVVNKLHPLGCTPYVTRKFNYTQCDETFNSGASAHNVMLDQAVKVLGGVTEHSAFLTLDLNLAFKSIIDQEEGARIFENTLKPCCEGLRNDTNCAEINSDGTKQYSLCQNPEDYFYWDTVHPTQSAWTAIFDFLKPSLNKFLV